jgi:starch-binding outer membrane protein, SusD/RagB family
MKYLLILSIVFLTSCEKFLKVDSPPGRLGSEDIFRTDITATSAMLAVYAQLESGGTAFLCASVAGISSDEMLNHQTAADWTAAASNNLTPDNLISSLVWTRFYQAIYRCNGVLNGMNQSNTITPSTKNILRGEALFMRAWCHFYLTSFFGHIPYITDIDPFSNVKTEQVSEQESFTKMEEDLLEARELLTNDYMTAQNRPGGERIRPNRSAAEALLARVYLYQGKWAAAATTATNVIAKQNQYVLVSDLSRVFLRTSQEAIWQMQPVTPTYNTNDGAQLNNTIATPLYISLTQQHFESFMPGDQRKLNWVRHTVVSGQSYYWPFKYKVGQGASSITEYSILLRLAELYLIRAEARARQNELTEAAEDLNAIRIRAGLAKIDLPDQATALSLIAQERRHELFSETGDRWYDLRRTGQINSTMAPIKGANWSPSDALYPIPQTEILRRPGMQQNPGY